MLLQALRQVLKGQSDGEDLPALLRVVAQDARASLPGVSMKGAGGAPDWAGYESFLWEVSEDLRQYVKKRRSIRSDHRVWAAVAELVADRSYGNGRENFVLMLGQYGGSAYADLIAEQLDDPAVSAHAIRALRLLDDGRFVDQARTLEAEPPTGAARFEARKYLKKFG